MGEPLEKPPDHPQAERGLSHMWSVLGLNSQRWNDKRFRAPEISILNHSATWAAQLNESMNISVIVGNCMQILEAWFV